MATVTVRNLDDAVVAALKSRAKANNRSLEAEIREILAAAAKPPAPDLVALSRAIRAMTPAGVAQTDSTLLVRENRDSR